MRPSTIINLSIKITRTQVTLPSLLGLPSGIGEKRENNIVKERENTYWTNLIPSPVGL